MERNNERIGGTKAKWKAIKCAREENIKLLIAAALYARC